MLIQLVIYHTLYNLEIAIVPQVQHNSILIYKHASAMTFNRIQLDQISHHKLYV